MYVDREPEDRIERYSGPYERWVFSNELGRPYSFPLIAGPSSGFYTALMEGGDAPQSDATMEVRLPPLWNPGGGRMRITPFVFENLGGPRNSVEVGQDTEIARALRSVRTIAGRNRSGITPRFRVNFPIVPEAWVETYVEGAAPTGWQQPAMPPKAIIAVIDDGIPFANRAFLDSQGATRISHCWLQSGIAEPVADIPFGRELVNATIDDLRARFGTQEDALYREAGAVSTGVRELGGHLRRAGTHGAHVLGLAAGNSSLFPEHPMGDDIQIIAVQLPNTIAWDTSGFGKEMYMLSAIHYVFNRASHIARAYGVPELPLVLNFSYGWSAGRHDGQSEMEIAIQDLLVARQALQPATAMTMPTGNNFDSQMHARIEGSRFDTRDVRIGWHLQPDDRTSSFLELWFPEGFDPSGYLVKLTPPRGVQLDPAGVLDVAPDTAMDGAEDGDPRRFLELVLDGKIIGQMSADQHRGNRWRVMIALVPTVHTRGQDRRAPSGTWTVSLSRGAAAQTMGPNDDLLIWLQRDDDPSDLKSMGRQSYLVDLDKDTRSRPARPTQSMAAALETISGFGALNGVASAPLTTRVAGYDQQSGRPSPYSGSGGLRDGPGGKIDRWGAHADVVAVSDHSMLRPGILSIGVLSGSRARFVGTSCAAPSAARLMVLNLAAGRDLYDGFDGHLKLREPELQTASVEAQQKARVGAKTAPPVSVGGTPVPTRFTA